MRIAEMNWMQVEDYLRRDDRAVLPLGSTEQHAYLSLATDSILPPREVRQLLGDGSFRRSLSACRFRDGHDLGRGNRRDPGTAGGRVGLT